MKKIILLFLVIIPFLGSCASIYMKKSERAAENIAESIDKGNSELPAQWSRVPFVFDGEILVTRSTVQGMWSGLVDAGFMLKDPVITSISAVGPEDFSLFRSSWEMEVLFKNKIPRYTYKVTVEGVKGEMLLLIFRNDDKEYSVMGLKAEAK